jgi:hypothetical protein
MLQNQSQILSPRFYALVGSQLNLLIQQLLRRKINFLNDFQPLKKSAKHMGVLTSRPATKLAQPILDSVVLLNKTGNLTLGNAINPTERHNPSVFSEANIRFI